MELREVILTNPSRILQVSDGEEFEQVVAELWSVAMDESQSKSMRKAAKKALYMAKSRGLDIERVKPALLKHIPRMETRKEIEGIFLTTPDSELLFLLIVALVNVQTGALDLLHFLIHPERGVRKYSLEHGAKKQLQRIRNSNPDLMQVPEQYGLYRLRKALKNTDRKKISGLANLPSILKLESATSGGNSPADSISIPGSPGPEDEIVHPVIDLLQVRLSRVFNPEYEKKIFQLGEVVRLSLPPEDMEEFRRNISLAQESRLIVDGKTPQERVEQEIDRLFSTYFTPQRRSLYRELLLDIALLLYHRGQEDHARILIDYANRLLNTAVPAREHPFLSFLVYKELFGQRNPPA